VGAPTPLQFPLTTSHASTHHAPLTTPYTALPLSFPSGFPTLTSRLLRLPSGLHVHIVECGEATAPAVVLLGGWGTSAYVYRKNLEPLAAAGLRAIAVEVKGQGLSDKPLDPAEYTLDSLAAHVLEILDALELPRVMLVGQSLGGAIATRLALAAPRRIARLALIAPVGFGRVRFVTLVRAVVPAALTPLLPRLAARWTFALGLRLAYGKLARPTARDIDEYYAPAGDPAFTRSLLSLIRQVDWNPLTPAQLHRLGVPLLIIFGTADRIIPPGEIERLLRDVPGARAVLIPGAGHAANEEAPEAVNRALIDFLKA
jgi:4,5:9,10-diseco-3-hydroxy-5,9,17-trioxoandrosta-1(10),2-diene-4-oate hydrolase